MDRVCVTWLKRNIYQIYTFHVVINIFILQEITSTGKQIQKLYTTPEELK